MHVCGSHEQAMARYGLRASFPEDLDYRLTKSDWAWVGIMFVDGVALTTCPSLNQRWLLPAACLLWETEWRVRRALTGTEMASSGAAIGWTTATRIRFSGTG